MAKKAKGVSTSIGDTKIHVSFTEQLLYSIVFLTIATLLLILSSTFRLFLALLLKIRHGKKFGGFVTGGDAIWFSETDSLPVNHIVFLYDSKMHSAAEFTTYIMDVIRKNPWHHNHPDTNRKFTSTCGKIAGYVYYLKHNVKISECHTTLSVDEQFVEKSKLTDILSQCSVRPLPKNNTALWELITLNKPLRTESIEEGTFTYVVIFRFHHSLGDGISISNSLVRNLIKDQSVTDGNSSKLMGTMNKLKVNPKKSGILNTINDVIKFVYVLAISATVNLKERRRFKDESNCLHGPKLSGEKHLVYVSEHSGERLVQAVKKIKNGTPGSTFSSVLLTAISRAIRKHFNMNCQETPNSIIALLPVPVVVPDVKAKVKIGNSLAYKMCDLPILRDEATVQEHLAAVVEGIHDVYNKTDAMAKYLLSNVFVGNFPIPMMYRSYVSIRKATICFSSMPGLPCDITPDRRLSEKYIFSSNFQNIELTFTANTYADNLTFCLNVDRTLIPMKQAAQDLIDNVMEEIRLMYDEFRSTSDRYQ